MTDTTPTSDETPAGDAAETAVETHVVDDASEYGESPDVETHDYEEPQTL